MSSSSSSVTEGHLIRRMGGFLFRYRSFTPIPLVFFIVALARVTYGSALLGFAVMAIGETIRLVAVRAAGKRTRSRQVRAPQLVTWGPYAYTRNPLYIGNLFLWLGAAVYAGGLYTPWIIAVVLTVFLLQYALIITLEEATLAHQFGAAYGSYCEAVPRVIPLISSRSRTLPPTGPGHELDIRAVGLHSWRYAIQSEKSTFATIATVLSLSMITTWFQG